MALTKDQILTASDLDKREVAVPEWGGSVFVRSLSGKERDTLESFWLARRDTGNLANTRAQLVALTVCDEFGNRLFTEEDVAALGEKSAKALQTIFDVSMELNAFTTKDVEELAGN